MTLSDVVLLVTVWRFGHHWRELHENLCILGFYLTFVEEHEDTAASRFVRAPCRGRGAATRIPVGCRLVRAADRQSRRSSRAAKPRNRRSMIPKLIHQTSASKDISFEERQLQKRFRRFLPDWELKLWTDADNAILVLRTFPAYYSSYKMRKGVAKADIARIIYMYVYGFYFDTL
jgi:hypothetical protein